MKLQGSLQNVKHDFLWLENFTPIQFIITINYRVQSFTSEVYVQLFTFSWKSKQVTQFYHHEFIT